MQVRAFGVRPEAEAAAKVVDLGATHAEVCDHDVGRAARRNTCQIAKIHVVHTDRRTIGRDGAQHSIGRDLQIGSVCVKQADASGRAQSLRNCCSVPAESRSAIYRTLARNWIQNSNDVLQ
jgi:hypothetical protein